MIVIVIIIMIMMIIIMIHVQAKEEEELLRKEVHAVPYARFAHRPDKNTTPSRNDAGVFPFQCSRKLFYLQSRGRITRSSRVYPIGYT